MALPSLIRNTYISRKRRFLEAYEHGAVSAHVHLPPNRDRCDICHTLEKRGLNLFRCPDGTGYKLGPDCTAAYQALNAGNIDELRKLVPLVESS